MWNIAKTKLAGKAQAKIIFLNMGLFVFAYFRPSPLTAFANPFKCTRWVLVDAGIQTRGRPNIGLHVWDGPR